MSKEPVSLHFPDLTSLQKAFMPFLTHGGLFVASENNAYALKDPMILEVKLPSSQGKENSPITVEGYVAWISQPDLQGQWKPGFGVAFVANEVNRRLKASIQDMLSQLEEQATDTL